MKVQNAYVDDDPSFFDEEEAKESGSEISVDQSDKENDDDLQMQ